MTKSIKVSIHPSSKKYHYGESIEIIVSVENVSSERLYIITKPPYMWKSDVHTIKVLLGEAKIPANLFYYDYTPPSMRLLTPGNTVKIPVSIGMPPREGIVDKGVYEWKETPVSGKVKINVTIGYLKRKFVPNTAAPWEEFLNQQVLSSPKEISVDVERK